MSTYAETGDRKAKALSILKDLTTKENLKRAGLETGKTLLSGLLGVGAGAALGKPALLTGLTLVAAGHLIKQSQVATFGLGMMASGGHKAGGSLHGTDGLQGAKDRLLAVKDNFLEQLYLDKFLKGKKSDKGKNNGTNGLGQAQHFKYDETKELDLGALSAIEAELNRSAERFENTSTGVSGAYEDYVTVQERNF